MNKDFKVIKSCRICNSKKILNILNLGNHPLANELNAFKNQKSKKYPLKLVFCSSCKTIQISATVDQKNYLINMCGQQERHHMLMNLV